MIPDKVVANTYKGYTLYLHSRISITMFRLIDWSIPSFGSLRLQQIQGLPSQNHDDSEGFPRGAVKDRQ